LKTSEHQYALTTENGHAGVVSILSRPSQDFAAQKFEFAWLYFLPETARRPACVCGGPNLHNKLTFGVMQTEQTFITLCNQLLKPASL
jgi:hypothetical protein